MKIFQAPTVITKGKFHLQNSIIGEIKMAMLKSKLFRTVFATFFVLTLMICLFNMAVFPGTPASYYVVLISKFIGVSLFNGVFYGTLFYLVITLINYLISKTSKQN